MGLLDRRTGIAGRDLRTRFLGALTRAGSDAARCRRRAEGLGSIRELGSGGACRARLRPGGDHAPGGARLRRGDRRRARVASPVQRPSARRAGPWGGDGVHHRGDARRQRVDGDRGGGRHLPQRESSWYRGLGRRRSPDAHRRGGHHRGFAVRSNGTSHPPDDADAGRTVDPAVPPGRPTPRRGRG